MNGTGTIRRVALATFVASLIAFDASARTFNILDYGAKPSLTGLNTKAIQATIDACSDAGGGTVLIPNGHYVIGTLFLKSNVTIQMEENAELLVSNSLEDYAEVPVATEEPHFSKCLFYADQAENIKILGGDRSEINGRGYFFKNSPQRPKLFRIERSRNIEIRNVTIKNSGSWCLVFTGCDSVVIKGVSIYNKENKNNDGIDLDGCSNVSITDCNLQVEDDAICLKSSIDKVCENITVENCTISSYWAAIKFGTASKSGFRNVKVGNCQFFDCRYGAIKLLAVDGAIIENIEFSDIKMFNCGGPIFLRLGNRGRSYDASIKQVYRADAKPEGRPVGKLRNIRFRNIEGRLVGRIDPTECILFTGLPGHYIEDVVLEHIHFSYSGHGALDVKHRKVPEDEARYPEQSFFGVLPAYGIYARHVNGLQMRNVTLQLRAHDSRPAIVMDDVIGSRLENVSADIKAEAGTAMILSNARDISLGKLKFSGQVEHSLEVRGKASGNIRLETTNAEVQSIKQLVLFSDQVDEAAVELKSQ